MQQQTKPSKIPYFFFAFFAVIIAMNVFYIYLANKSWRGVITKDSYEKGVNYNEVLLQVKKQNEMGWKVDARYKSLNEKTGLLTVKLADKNFTQIRDANIRANFKRPTQEGFDFSVPLVFVKDSYQAKLSFPLKGQWEVELAIARGDEMFYEVKRYVIQ
jgi:nitrogen fixation protein FixH